MVQEHKFAKKLREKQEKADAGDAAAAKYLGSQAAQSLRDYLNPDPVTGGGGVPESRGGGLGAVQAHDPVLSAGSEAAQLARENLLYQPGGKRRGNLTAADIKGINIPLVRQGLSGDDYFRFNQMLYSPNIQEYEKARPFSSGKTVRDIVRLATPAKYLGIGANWLKDKAVDAGQAILDAPSNIMDSTMVEAVTEDWESRKKGRGWKGLVEDALNMVGIGNTKKTNEFITKKTDSDTDGEIKTNMEDIKTHKKKTIDLHELTDLKAKRNELYNKITQGGNEPGLMSQYEQITSKILELEQGQLQDFKEGGIASLATGGLLEKERVRQPFSPLNAYGQGGLGSLFGQGGPRGGFWPPKGILNPQHPIQSPQHGFNQFGEQLGGFEETLGGYGEQLGGFGEQIGGFGEQLGGYQDVLGGYGQDISSFKETMGGFGNQFENINNKLTSMEEGIASLSDKIGTTQGNTQPPGRPNFGYGFNAYSPWMFGGFGRGRYG